MSAVADALAGLQDPGAAQARLDGESRLRLEALLARAEPLGAEWAAGYDTAWALEGNIRRDARTWSAQAARNTVRHLRAPQASLVVLATVVLSVGSANLVTTLVLMPRLGALTAGLLAAPGMLVSGFGVVLALRYASIVAQHRAGIPPFRDRLQAELERRALAALDRRRERLAGPRRPLPRHGFHELLPAQAHNLAAGWMRHLGELDATVLRPEGLLERFPALQPGHLPALQPDQAHVISSGYVGRVWSFAAETPDMELALLEDAAAATGKRPLLFSLSGFSESAVARANRRGIALLTYGPWDGTLHAHGTQAERYLRRGLRDVDGMTT